MTGAHVHSETAVVKDPGGLITHKPESTPEISIIKLASEKPGSIRNHSSTS